VLESYFPYLGYLPGVKKHKTRKDPTEQAKKRLKRDFDFSFDKEKQIYIYKGHEISEETAVEIVKEHGLSELKEKLEG
jgi:hypothetical protein